MRIEFVRSGGFAGIRLALDLDTADLPPEDAARLTRIVQEARNALDQTPPARPGPDQYQYDLTIDDQAGGRVTYTLCEPHVPVAARTLLDQLTALARRRL